MKRSAQPQESASSGGRPSRRVRAEDRLEDVIEAAVDIFAERGFRRTQMADVARHIGVSPGNLYNYVESKEALFHLVLQRTLGLAPNGSAQVPIELPVSTPSMETTVEWLRRRLDFSDFPAMNAALVRKRVPDPKGEAEAVIGELFDVLAHLRRGIDVLERSAEDVPQILALVFVDIRRELVGRITRYLDARARAGKLRKLPDSAATARAVLEVVAWFARDRHHDLDTRGLPDDVARKTVVDLVVNGLVKK